MSSAAAAVRVRQVSAGAQAAVTAAHLDIELVRVFRLGAGQSLPAVRPQQWSSARTISSTS